MRGFSLAMNMVVIIVVVIIVLLVVVALLITYSKGNANYEALYRLGCLKLITSCSKSTSEIHVDSGDQSYTLSEICGNIGLGENDCKKGCGC
jgi:archaellum biogenesis protein FlaJ (TadC family)